jgi:hypothetical protein
VIVAAGCGQEEVRSYRVPKAETSAPVARPRLTWQTPSGWVEKPGNGIRVASFEVMGAAGQQALVSVVPLPGTAGSDLDNVNRWRGQVGLAPVTEAAGQNITVADEPALLYEMTTTNVSILAAIQRRGETAWFYKMTGDAALVAAQKETFVRFLREVRY